MTKIIVDDPEWFDEDERYMELPCASGTTRDTYIGKEWVYKRPRGEWAQKYNDREALHYRNTRSATRSTGDDMNLERYEGVPIAECYRLHDGTLKMRRVKTIRNLITPAEVTMRWEDLPPWCDRIDMAQVGYDDRGQIVAYDL